MIFSCNNLLFFVCVVDLRVISDLDCSKSCSALIRRKDNNSASYIENEWFTIFLPSSSSNYLAAEMAAPVATPYGACFFYSILWKFRSLSKKISIFSLSFIKFIMSLFLGKGTNGLSTSATQRMVGSPFGSLGIL